MKPIPLNVKGETSVEVTAETLASRLGSGAVEVFSTPSLILAMEEASARAISPYLEEGETTVGFSVNIRHLAATPLGLRVRAVACLEKVEGRKITFHVEAFDDFEKVGEGIHERYVVNYAKFISKAKDKSTRKN